MKRVAAAIAIVVFGVFLIVVNQCTTQETFSQHTKENTKKTISIEKNKKPLVPCVENTKEGDALVKEAYTLYKQEGGSGLVKLEQRPEISEVIYQQMFSSQSDRYVCLVEEEKEIYGMVYLSKFTGGYWWYFGEMSQGLRQGKGTTIVVLPYESYQTFSGTYEQDFPKGKGSLEYYNAQAWYKIKGDFQGKRLNGTYQCSGFNRVSSKKSVTAEHTYEDGHLVSVADVILPEGKEMFLYFPLENGAYMGWDNQIAALNQDMEVFWGNETLSHQQKQ